MNNQPTDYLFINLLQNIWNFSAYCRINFVHVWVYVCLLYFVVWSCFVVSCCDPFFWCYTQNQVKISAISFKNSTFTPHHMKGTNKIQCECVSEFKLWRVRKTWLYIYHIQYKQHQLFSYEVQTKRQNEEIIRALLYITHKNFSWIFHFFLKIWENRKTERKPNFNKNATKKNYPKLILKCFQFEKFGPDLIAFIK